MNATPDREGLPGLSRRDIVVRLGGGGLAALMMTASRAQPSIAQEPTYPPENPAVGVLMQMMGLGQPEHAAGMELTLRRITLVLGGRLPTHSHPGALLIVVEAGTFGYTHLGGKAQLTRATADGTPGPADGMPFAEETILNPGDWLFVQDPRNDVRNAGDEHVVLLVAAMTPVGEPFTTFMSRKQATMDATPAG